MDSCGGCKKTIKGASLACSLCDQWFDVKCSGSDQATVDFLNSPAGQKSSVHWHCTSCDISTKRLFDLVTAVSGRLTIVEEKVDKLNSAIGSLSDKIEFILPGSPAVASAVSPPTEKSEIVAAVAGEIREREKRALKVVFTGEVTEEKVKKFIGHAGGDATKIDKIETKGKKVLYITTLTTEAQKWTLIKKGRTISNTIEGLNGIFVNPDLTRSEREVQYNLRQELRRRRAEGENLVIKKGRIVEKKE